jgi:hypothetical protein
MMLRSILLFLSLLAAGPALAVDVVIFDRPAVANDHRLDYPRSVLRAVMERTAAEFGPYRIESTPAPMERRRMFQALHGGVLVNVAAYPADAEWVRELLSVPIPVDLGLQSWRIALIDKRKQEMLRGLAHPSGLKELRAGAGSFWVTLRVLRANGFRVVAGNQYQGLFDMLMAGRFDYFPRGVNEIFGELDARRGEFPLLAVEERFLLHDRVPVLFFISPKTPRLHRRIAAGMEAMLKDGTLERMLIAHYGKDLRRARLCGRDRIELVNTELDPAPFARKELWFDPTDPRHGLCPGR